MRLFKNTSGDRVPTTSGSLISMPGFGWTHDGARSPLVLIFL